MISITLNAVSIPFNVSQVTVSLSVVSNTTFPANASKEPPDGIGKFNPILTSVNETRSIFTSTVTLLEVRLAIVNPIIIDVVAAGTVYTS